MAGVRRFEDLIAWQRSMDLCNIVFEITCSGPSVRDQDFHGQIRSAAKKAPALISEGFLRYTAPEMVRYLRMARAEIGEVQNHLEFARRQKYFTTDRTRAPRPWPGGR